jgi:hypothetical protein
MGLESRRRAPRGTHAGVPLKAGRRTRSIGLATKECQPRGSSRGPPADVPSCGRREVVSSASRALSSPVRYHPFRRPAHDSSPVPVTNRAGTQRHRPGSFRRPRAGIPGSSARGVRLPPTQHSLVNCRPAASGRAPNRAIAVRFGLGTPTYAHGGVLYCPNSNVLPHTPCDCLPCCSASLPSLAAS